MQPYAPLYHAAVLGLGLTMLGTLIYGLCSSPGQTISSDMYHKHAYLATLTIALAGHVLIWACCLYAKRRRDPEAFYWGVLALLVMAVGWVGLVTNLLGTTHLIFVAIFASAFCVSVLILCYLVWQPDLSVLLRVGLLLTLFVDIVMVVLYNSDQFYLPEHVNFINYTVFFTVFFSYHPYYDWARLPEDPETTRPLLV